IRLAQSGNLWTSELVRGGGEADRQMARWIDLAREDPRNRRASANTWIKGFEDRGDLALPAHVDRAAGLGNDDGLRVGLGDCGDERILVAHHLEARLGPFAVVASDEDDRDVRPCGQS